MANSHHKKVLLFGSQDHPIISYPKPPEVFLALQLPHVHLVRMNQKPIQSFLNTLPRLLIKFSQIFPCRFGDKQLQELSLALALSGTNLFKRLDPPLSDCYFCFLHSLFIFWCPWFFIRRSIF